MICEEIPKTRKEALERGLSYYLGNPCKKGHNEGRYTAYQHCIVCSKIKRAHQTKNSDKNREKEIDREWRKKDRLRDPEKYSKRWKEYRNKNKEKYDRYQKDNLGYFAHHAAMRRYQKKVSNYIKEEDDIKDIFIKASKLDGKYEVDHIYPLKGSDSCGLHVPWNIQIIPEKENRQKRNKKPSDFYGLTDYEIWYILQDDLKAYQPKNLDTKE